MAITQETEEEKKEREEELLDNAKKGLVEMEYDWSGTADILQYKLDIYDRLNLQQYYHTVLKY